MHAVGEHGFPVGIGGADSHVVGHDVEQNPHPSLVQRRGEGVQIVQGADLRIHARRIDDVVAVHAPGPRGEYRRTIEMRDAEPVQIGHDAARRGERELLVQLYTIRRAQR